VVPYYRTGTARPIGQPIDTVTTRDRFALTTPPQQHPPIAVEDCRFRMLKPRESLRAQRFPDTYTVHGNQGEQTMQAGNAVAANVAQFIGQRLAAALAATGGAA
jgi:DNA (cytosine-5)-methyltransferase 1